MGLHSAGWALQGSQRRQGLQGDVTYEQCGAFASNGHDAGWGKAPTKDKAEASAMNACEKKDCVMVTSDCN